MMSKKSPNQSIQRHIVWGAAAAVVLFGGVGGWALTTELTGAVIAPGTLVVESDVKKVQHPSGGVVGEIRVKDGSKVEAGDVLLRLDETVTRASLAIVVKGLNELSARRARLEAERDDAQQIHFRSDLLEQGDQFDVESIVSSEEKLFQLRRSSRQGQKAQLAERIKQLDEEIGGLTGQSSSKRKEIGFIDRELGGVRELWEKKLVPINRVMVLEREAVRLDGESNQLIASAAQAKGKKIETELQILQIDQDLRSDVAKELREIQGKVAELVERKVAAEDQLKRIDIRSPQRGIVHQMSVHTVGGVIGPSEPLMLIVPEDDSLSVEIKIAPNDIDQIRMGQQASLRFSAFSQRTTPQLNGVVSRVSPDIALDQKSGVSYYVGRIAISKEEIDRLNGLRLVPGMPVDAFVQTDSRSVMSYLLKPLRDQIVKAFRER